MTETNKAALAPAEKATPQKTSSIVTCCVTGAIPGDGGACGDCDPCIMGEALVPDPVKRLISEKNSLLNRIGELEGELEEYRATPAPACVVYGVPLIKFLDGLADNAKAGKRRSLNPIINGNSAKLFADEIRAATPTPPSADVARQTIEACRLAIEYSMDMGCSDPACVLLQALNKCDAFLIQSAAPGGGTKSDGLSEGSLPSGESELAVTPASGPSDAIHLLRQVTQSRAVDYVEAIFPGWHDRVLALIEGRT